MLQEFGHPMMKGESGGAYWKRNCPHGCSLAQLLARLALVSRSHSGANASLELTRATGCGRTPSKGTALPLREKGCELRPSFGTGAPAFERTYQLGCEKGGFINPFQAARRSPVLDARSLKSSTQSKVKRSSDCQQAQWGHCKSIRPLADTQNSLTWSSDFLQLFFPWRW